MFAFVESFERRQLMAASPIQVLTPTQRANWDDFVAAAKSLVGNDKGGKTAVQTLSNDLLNVARVGKSPSAAAVKSMNATIKAAFSDKKITVAEAKKIGNDVHAVLLTAKVSNKTAEATSKNLSHFLSTGSFNSNKLQRVVNSFGVFLGVMPK